MAEETPSLHIDTDWKKQAQEEKRKLAEQEQKRAAEAPPPQRRAPGAGAGRGQRDLPPASFASLVQLLLTQALLYLGDLAPRGSEPMVDLDMAKRQIDTLAVLEEKTRANLTDEEKRMLDAALYEARMRYVSVASQFI